MIDNQTAINTLDAMKKQFLGETREVLDMAIHAIEESQQYKAIGTVSIKPVFMHNLNDTTSLWKCSCGKLFKTKHESGVIDGTDIHFCVNCGCKYDWSEEEE